MTESEIRAALEFSVLDPEHGKPIEHFQIVHEKLFHMFVISQDLQYFVHDHPTFGSDGKFRYEIVFFKPALYRILGDFYPDGATPQLIAKTIIVPGGSQATPSLTRDYSTKDAGNMKVALETDAPQPIAGSKTMMFFTLDPADGLEKYIGAWGHMLAASDDLIDLIHTHPFLADGGPKMQFNVYFPRPQKYRVWVQFQRKGVVNTAYFDDVPVRGWAVIVGPGNCDEPRMTAGVHGRASLPALASTRARGSSASEGACPHCCLRNPHIV